MDSDDTREHHVCSGSSNTMEERMAYPCQWQVVSSQPQVDHSLTIKCKGCSLPCPSSQHFGPGLRYQGSSSVRCAGVTAQHSLQSMLSVPWSQPPCTGHRRVLWMQKHHRPLVPSKEAAASSKMEGESTCSFSFILKGNF